MIGFYEILIVLFGVLLFILPAALIYIVIAANKEWQGTYEGHSIILQNRILGEKLYIDGQAVDSSFSLLSTTLRGRLELEGGRHAVVEGRVGQGFLGLTIKGRIFVDDRYIGGDPL